MANDKDKIYEKIYFLWKGEGERQNKSIDWYCDRYHVDVEDWRKWYRGISKAVKEVKIIGGPTGEEPAVPEENPLKVETEPEGEPRIVITTSDSGKNSKETKIAITIKCSNGINITRKGMSYAEFLAFAQKLEALC